MSFVSLAGIIIAEELYFASFGYLTEGQKQLLHRVSHRASHGKSFESVQCAITGPCLHMRHSPSA